MKLTEILELKRQLQKSHDKPHAIIDLLDQLLQFTATESLLSVSLTCIHAFNEHSLIITICRKRKSGWLWESCGNMKIKM